MAINVGIECALLDDAVNPRRPNPHLHDKLGQQFRIDLCHLLFPALGDIGKVRADIKQTANGR
jgi:hypothetical protein